MRSFVMGKNDDIELPKLKDSNNSFLLEEIDNLTVSIPIIDDKYDYNNIESLTISMPIINE